MTNRTKPKSIRLFNRFNLAATLIGVANIVTHYGVLRNRAIANGSSPAGPFLGIVLLALSYWIFRFFIYRRGSRIAKWLFVIVTAGAAAMIPFNLGEVLAVGTLYAATDGVAFAAQIAATAMLFRADAGLWLRRKSGQESDG